MDKLDLQTPNFSDTNIEKLALLFPNCITEASDAKGKVTKAIDFDLLKQELSDNIVDGPRERYQINWPGKREALVSANTPINKTLRPCREESVEFDTTENLYIEGDNLEALKLLQESYLAKIKMIYIDPPYNTGKDFVYRDNFTSDKEAYEQDSEQRDEEGGRLISNPDADGRYHSNWLDMMYPRLKLARNLMKENGVILFSIDDNEVANLKKMCDEVFGEDNFVTQFAWRRTDNQANIGSIARVKEYILSYAKHKKDFSFNKIPLSEKAKNEYSYSDSIGQFRRRNILDKSRGKKTYEIIAPNGDVLPGPWMIEREEFNRLEKEGKIYWASEKMPYGKKYLHESEGQIISDWLTKDFGTNQRASEEMDQLFDIRAFDFPKPTSLIQTFIKIGTNSNDLILDFFSGSATTAHAAMKQNTQDNSHRKYIMVQLPEETNEKSEAYKAEYKTIPEIAKERIRRAGKKVKEDNADKEGIEDLDIGFRVLKIDSSNMKDVYYSPDDVTQDSLFDTIENIKEGRSAEDLLFQVLLDWGVDLSLPIVREEIQGKSVYFVDEDTLAACFEDDLDEAFVKELAAREVMRVVFKDSGFAQDDIKSNVEQIFKQLSPETEVKAI